LINQRENQDMTKRPLFKSIFLLSIFLLAALIFLNARLNLFDSVSAKASSGTHPDKFAGVNITQSVQRENIRKEAVDPNRLSSPSPDKLRGAPTRQKVGIRDEVEKRPVQEESIWTEPSFYVAVLSILVASLIFVIGSTILSDFITKKKTAYIRLQVKESLLSEIASPFKYQVAVNESLFETNLLAFQRLSKFYNTLWEWLSGSAEDPISPEDAKEDFAKDLESVFQSFRLGLWHIQLFSQRKYDVELAIREIQGTSSVESIKHLTDFIALRKQNAEFEKVVDLAIKVVKQIENVHNR